MRWLLLRLGIEIFESHPCFFIAVVVNSMALVSWSSLCSVCACTEKKPEKAFEDLEHFALFLFSDW